MDKRQKAPEELLKLSIKFERIDRYIRFIISAVLAN
jgi:hypothetical protein